jgi:peroxiredoxin
VPLAACAVAVSRLNLLAGACLVAVLGCAPRATDATHVQTASQPSVQAQASARPPDFELEALDGQSLRLSTVLGSHVVLLEFWATYCEPCLTSMPHLQDLYQRYQKDGLLIWGISIDGPESVAQVRAEVAKLGLTFPIGLDDESRVVSLYNPKTTAPFSVLIGRDGQVLSRYEGYSEAAAAKLDAQLAQVLRASQAP